MRIVNLEIENLKRIRAVSITPTGNVVKITGPNGSGKSSVLDAIFWALAGMKNVTSQPVRRGEPSARIKLNLGEVLVTRRFTAAGNSELIVEAANGAQFRSPQRMLDELLGALTFDPLAFARMEAKEQLETLRRLVSLDVDVDALDAQNARDYAIRTDWNRRVQSFNDRVATAAEGVDFSIDVSPIDVSALVAQMASAVEHNQAVAAELAHRSETQRSIDEFSADAKSCRTRAEELLRRADQAEQKARTLAKELAQREAHEPIADTIVVSDLRERIETARADNAARDRQDRIRHQHASAVRELDEAKAEALKLTQAMAARTEQKRTAIARAKMPLDGLAFGDGLVMYNDIPFDQASSAEQLRVSVALAMAANPKLRVLRIKDGSLLDEASLAAIGEMAAEKDYQIWIEQVDTSGRVGIVMSDGDVVAINEEQQTVDAA
jgi:predicted ABC-type transport system involved in lysophospholipase L1 biosynthesis ATPase subunit